MKQENRLRLLLCLLMMMVTVGASAQSTGDMLFAEGQKLERAETISSLNQAIKKYKAAKAYYTRDEKKKTCDNRISACYKKIKQIKEPPKSETPPEPEPPTLTLGNERVVLDYKNGFCNISVKSNRDDWKVYGSAFIGDYIKCYSNRYSNTIHIEIEENPKTTQRMSYLWVSASNGKKEERRKLAIIQRGKPVAMGCSTNLLEFKPKGGKKPIEIYTNSDSIISLYSKKCWKVEAKPDWVQVNIEKDRKPKKFKNGIVPVGNDSHMENVNVDCLDIEVAPLPKSDPAYLTGRMGELIFVSQDRSQKVIIVQQK